MSYSPMLYSEIEALDIDSNHYRTYFEDWNKYDIIGLWDRYILFTLIVLTDFMNFLFANLGFNL